MPSRAVVLGTNAYPYLMAYWLHLFNTVWCEEVDKVYIAVSQPVHPSAWAFTRALLKTNEKIEVIKTNLNWPMSITKVLKQVKESHVMIPHDDLFIFEKGVVDKMFRVAEKGKVVTPIHSNYTPPHLINELMQMKWSKQLPMVEEDTEATGYSFFCNFFFAPMSLMRQTSMDFGGYLVKQGEYSPLLDFTPLTQEIHADTNFKLGLELLDAGAEFYCPREIDFKRYLPISMNPTRGLKALKKLNGGLYDQPYLHLQTFSYHLQGLLPDYGFYEEVEQIRYGDKGGEVPHSIDNVVICESSKHDSMIKMAVIRVFMMLNDWDGIKKYHKYTLKEFDYIMKYMHISKSEMQKVVSLFYQLLLDRTRHE